MTDNIESFSYLAIKYETFQSTLITVFNYLTNSVNYVEF